jgi:hypothetical protein
VITIEEFGGPIVTKDGVRGRQAVELKPLEDMGAQMQGDCWSSSDVRGSVPCNGLMLDQCGLAQNALASSSAWRTESCSDTCAGCE